MKVGIDPEQCPPDSIRALGALKMTQRQAWFDQHPAHQIQAPVPVPAPVTGSAPAPATKPLDFLGE
jgi:hypothetical protein